MAIVEFYQNVVVVVGDVDDVVRSQLLLASLLKESVYFYRMMYLVRSHLQLEWVMFSMTDGHWDFYLDAGDDGWVLNDHLSFCEVVVMEISLFWCKVTLV